MTEKLKSSRVLAVLVLSIAMLALLLRLGLWQLERAQYKEKLAEQAQQNSTHSPLMAHEIIEQTTAEAWYFRSARVNGRFDPTHQYLLDNRTFDGRAGYHVLSVFTYGTQHLLVNRGWLPVGTDRQVLPDIKINARQQILTGHLAPLPGSGLLLGDTGYGQPGWPKVVQNVELDSMNTQLGFALLPAVLLLDPAHPACLRCRWVAARGLSADRHRGYAIQWFSLAVAFVVLLGVASFNRDRGNAS